MRIILLLLAVSFASATPIFAQQRLNLKVRIDKLADRILKSVDKDDLFIKSEKSYISEEDHKAIKKIIMTNGFPTIPMVGKESSHKFWMLVQLCDIDPRMQMAVTKHMGFLMRSGLVIKEDFAMLSDRARMNKSLPQLYGTQFVISDVGTVLLYNTYDLEHIDARRKSIGLTRFKDYEDRIASAKARKTQVGDAAGYSDY